jgi:cobalt-zinc-cadmium efflux system outer membrane protein
MLSTSLAPAAGTISEADAIRMFVEHWPQARRVPVVQRSVDAAFRAESRITDPQLAYQVEEAGGTRDEFLTIEQALPVTGRRGLLGERATAAASAAALDAAARLQGELYALKRLFAEVLYRERQLEALQDGELLLQRTVEILEQREREGEGSGYDAMRAGQELAELRMTIAGSESALATARSRFGSFFVPERRMDEAVLTGDLAPSDDMPGADEAIDAAMRRRLDLRARSAELKRWQLESKAARRSRVPEPVLTVGWKRSEFQGLTDSGYVAGVSVPLPVFSRARLESARAAAEAEGVALDREILVRRIHAKVRAAIARERSARDAAARYVESMEQQAGEISRIAQLRYDEGEGGIVELLDAQRSSLNASLRALAARYEVRLAEIDRNRVTGSEVQP